MEDRIKTETILDAMLTVHREMLFEFGKYASAQEIKESKRYRQLHAFRDRIIRLDAEKKELIDKLFKIIGDRERIIREKDARIAELEASLNLRDEVLADYEIDWELWRE